MKGKNPKSVVFGFFRCAAAAFLATRKFFRAAYPPEPGLGWLGEEIYNGKAVSF